MESIDNILKRHWGYDSFRPMQREAIESVTSGHDTMGLLPTGAGKSVIFQVAGLAVGGLTLVVTPLIALMKDQVDHLRQRGIKAVFLHASMTGSELSRTWETLRNGRCRFLYVSPERLGNERFIAELKRLDIRMIAVDEAHCISQWGYDFRPAYLNIGSLRKHLPKARVLALTATATPRVVKDICHNLLMDDAAVFTTSFARPNISYIVRRTDNKLRELEHILTHTSGSTIIYTRSRKRTAELADHIRQLGISSIHYHAGLDYEVKEERQNSWMRGEQRVMVATNAFGMGIDKPDVRLVVHYDSPSSLEEYYQEAGRAGRDGNPSFAVLLTTTRDRATMKRRMAESFPERETVLKIYEMACNFLNLGVGEGYDRFLEFNIGKFCETFHFKRQTVKNALQILSASGYMSYIEESDIRSRALITTDRERLYSIELPSADCDTVLSTMLRRYTGLFTEYAYLDENELAMYTGLTEQRVLDALIDMGREKVIHYVPRKRTPFIHMLTRREETQYVTIPRKAYEERLDALKERMEAMTDYMFAQTGCRVKRILRYFGEDGSDCRSCDICRSGRSRCAKSTPKPNPADIKAHIVKILLSGVFSYKQIIDAFPGNADVAQSVLDSMIDNGEIGSFNNVITLSDKR